MSKQTTRVKGSSLPSKIYKKLVNAYINRVDPQHKRSRELYEGEYHIPLHNFSGPGTRLDIPEVKNFPPYNHIDACSKQHDIDYEDIKASNLSKEEKAKEIQKADKKALECYDKHPEEYGYKLARAGIQGKVSLESLISLLRGKSSVLYGGLVHNFTDKALKISRLPKYYTDEEKMILNLLKINDDSVVAPIGSFTFGIQKYPSDIDINQIVTISSVGSFIDDLKTLILKIRNFRNPNFQVYFSDFKAGKNQEGDGIHWTADELLNGKKVGGKGDIIPLEDALLQESVIKIDIIVIDNERIIEASSFFILTAESDGRFINLPENFFDEYVENLKKEIIKFSNEGVPPGKYKLFKAVKRLWSLARVQGNNFVLKKLANLIDSNVSLLGQINADVETTQLLLEKYPQLSKRTIGYLINIFNNFEKKLSTIIDIDIPYDELSGTFEVVKRLLRKMEQGKKSAEDIMPFLEATHDRILEIMNDETKQYLQYVKLWPLNALIENKA